MSTEEQEKSGAAEDDYRQSQIYTATEDTLFTKTTLTLSGAHSLVSMSLEYLPSEIENWCLFLYASAWIASFSWV